MKIENDDEMLVELEKLFFELFYFNKLIRVSKIQ